MVRTALRGLILLVLLAGCAAQVPAPAVSPSTLAPPSSSGSPALAGVPSCADVPIVEAPAERYADAPIYVGNEMPVEAVHAWASRQPGFEGIWIDRAHLGWITVAFSRDADARQADLEEQFPGDGVVTVEVEWTNAELEALARRAVDELGSELGISAGVLPNYGVVNIGLGVLSPERLAAVARHFAGERVCVEGIDPAELPPAGPQPLEGEGWRLVADERTGMPYRTGIAWDAESLRTLWTDASLTGEAPKIDFDAHVVIWFGAVYSGSCPNIRLDDVAVDAARAVVHAVIVSLDAANACTADANPRAFVVTLERRRLPAPPFTVQLGANGGLAEERTIVDADLRPPASTAARGQVHGEVGVEAPTWVESGDVIETGFPMDYRMAVHCGAEWLGELNGITWRTEVPPGAIDWIPPEWEPLVQDEAVVVSVLMESGDPPTLTVTANGRDVVYLPATDGSPGCD